MNDLTPSRTAVEAFERRRVAAMVAADIDTLDDLLHDELLFGDTNGRAVNKDIYLKKFKTVTVNYSEAH